MVGSKIKKDALIVIGRLSYPNGSAPSNRVHLYCKALKKSGGFPFVINLDASFTEKKRFGFLGRNDGIPFYFCQKTSHRENNFIIRNLRKIRGLINCLIFIARSRKHKNIKVLFFSINFSYEAILFLYLKILGVPIVRECNEAPLFIRKEKKNLWLHTFFHKHFRLRMYDGIIVISDYLYNYYSAICPKEKIFQIPILVDLARFDNLIKTPHNNNKIITYVGYMGGDKDGLEQLIEVMATVTESISNVKLVLIGSAPKEDMKRLKNKVDELKQGKYIIFTGKKSAEEIPEFLFNSDLLVLARPDNKQAQAGFPTKLGEYLASKNPVVITRTGDIPKYLTNDENAYLANPDDNLDFARKVLKALNDKNAPMIGLRGYEIAKNNFNYNLYGEKLLNIIQNK